MLVTEQLFELLTSLLNYFVLNSLLAFWPGLNFAQRLQPMFTPVYTGHATGICDCAPQLTTCRLPDQFARNEPTRTELVLDEKFANESEDSRLKWSSECFREKFNDICFWAVTFFQTVKRNFFLYDSFIHLRVKKVMLVRKIN